MYEIFLKCDVTCPWTPSPVTNCHTFPDPLPPRAGRTLRTVPKVPINFVINTNRRSTFGPLGSGRLPETSGDQMPAQNFTCQHNSASRRKNQSAARHHKTEILTFYSRHLITSNIISFAKSLLVLHHDIIHSRFCKTGYASLFGVGLHNIELNIEIYHPQSSK